MQRLIPRGLLPLLFVAGLGAVLLLPVGCGGEGGGAGGKQVRPSAKQAPKTETKLDAAALPKEQRYSYNSIGKRDPFRSFIQKEVVVKGDGSSLSPLQIHEIDEYRLRGIVWNIDAPRALVEDPDGIGHVVELGTLIGKNWGKVTQIKPEEIVITEEYRDPIENELIVNEITMRLPDPEMERKKKSK